MKIKAPNTNVITASARVSHPVTDAISTTAAVKATTLYLLVSLIALMKVQVRNLNAVTATARVTSAERNANRVKITVAVIAAARITLAVSVANRVTHTLADAARVTFPFIVACSIITAVTAATIMYLSHWMHS